MATKEKQKKRSLFPSFYKLSGIKNHHKPKSQPAVAVVSRSQSQQQSHSHASNLQNRQETEPAVLRSNNNLVLKNLGAFEQIANGGRRSVDGGGGGGGRGINNYAEARKSVSHVETNLGTNLASVISFLQVKVLACDMPGFMQVHAFRCARTTYDSLEKFSSKHIAFNIKKEFDKVYGPAWHCIVGSGFGSYVTHSTGCFLYFSMEKLYILVFQTKVQKALDSN
ncbi:hypothetical protein AB3S75_016710 [Citrus x aurantiifolia]